MAERSEAEILGSKTYIRDKSKSCHVRGQEKAPRSKCDYRKGCGTSE
jgi:hypothetical protein